jgi:pimeloyl-ACP methyl ester carboxylesterase
MTIARAWRDDIEIAYETFGSPPGDPLLLIMGVGAQMLYWHDEFCLALAERRFQVARFDNRDAGLSTHLSSAGVPSQLKMLRRPAEAAVYRLEDMADDAVAVLDALGWAAAHVVGRSLGGMIAQTTAVRHPSRVLSLTSISSTPSARIGRATLGMAVRLLLANPAVLRGHIPASPEEAAEQLVRGHRVVGSPGYALDEVWLREVGRRMYERGGIDAAGRQRQNAAILAGGDRRTALAGVRVPTLVVHGEADPLIRPVGGEATAAAIPGATLVTFPGMGHDLPREVWPAIIDAIRALADRAGQLGGGREIRPEP